MREEASIDEILERAVTQHRAGDGDGAAVLYKQILATDPTNIQVLHLLGVYHHQNNRSTEALEFINQALAVDPNFIQALFNGGVISQALSKPDDALSFYYRLLEHDELHTGAHINLGNILVASNQNDEALAHYQKVIEIAPSIPEAWCNAGSIFHERAQLSEARRHYLNALEIKPDYSDALANLGDVYFKHNEYDQAEETLKKAIALAPNNPEAHNNLGNIVRECGQLDVAILHYTKATALNSVYAEAYNNLSCALQDLGRSEEALSNQQKALSLKPDYPKARSNMLMGMHYTSIDPQYLYEEHCKWQDLHGNVDLLPHLTPSGAAYTPTKLRVGFVSGDFRFHSVSFFLSGLFKAFDQNKLEIYAYSSSLIEDEMTQHLRKHCHQWRQITGLPNTQAAELIHDDQLHILIDLAGHTAKNKLGVFAYKPAPIQVSWLGYPNTTGLAVMDYRLSDDIIDPVGVADALSSETIIRLPHGMHCFTAPKDAPEVSGLPALKNGYITFGSFNNLAKITPDVVALWSQVLHRVPTARLILKNKGLGNASAQQRYRDLFDQNGIQPDRILFHSHTAKRENHLALYGDIDISLDTFPYNGTTTTCEALWMGVPVLSILGRHHAARVGASLLTQINLPDYVRKNDQDFVDHAELISKDIGALATQRAALRPLMQASELCQPDLHARDVEQVFGDMWTNYISP